MNVSGVDVSQRVEDPEVWTALETELRGRRRSRWETVRRSARRLGSSAKQDLRGWARQVLPEPVRRKLKKAAELAGIGTPPALTLMYHRIAEPELDPHQLCVAPRHFEEHLEVLRRNFRPVPLSQLAGGLRDGRWHPRSVAVTVDDGYRDNLEIAKPLLERNGIPATVFVTSGALGSTRGFWWDELAELLLRPGPRPPILRLVVKGVPRTWRLADAREDANDEAGSHRSSNESPVLALSSRETFFRTFQKIMLELETDEKWKILDRLRTWSGAAGEARSDGHVLSRDELSALARGEGIEVGAHTVNHPVLPLLPISEQYAEIRLSKSELEQLIDRPVESFAYPHGECSPDTVIAVQAAGFLRACTTRRAAVRRGGDPFQIPRIKIQDWDGEQFARELDRWFRS